MLWDRAGGAPLPISYCGGMRPERGLGRSLGSGLGSLVTKDPIKMVSPAINVPRKSVGDLKEFHEQAVKAASPSTSPVRSKSLSPQPPPATLAPAPTPADDNSSSAPNPAPAPGALTAVIEDVEDVAVVGSDAEVVDDGSMTESGLFGQAGDKDKEDQAGEEVDPITALKDRIAQMSENEKISVESNLDRISGYPTELPLSVAWSEYNLTACSDSLVPKLICPSCRLQLSCSATLPRSSHQPSNTPRVRPPSSPPTPSPSCSGASRHSRLGRMHSLGCRMGATRTSEDCWA